MVWSPVLKVSIHRSTCSHLKMFPIKYCTVTRLSRDIYLLLILPPPPPSFLPLSPPISTQVLVRFELLGSCGSFGVLSRNRSLWVTLKTLLLTRPLLPGWPTGKEVATNSFCHRQSLQLLCPFCLMDCISISCIWVNLSPYDATKETGTHSYRNLQMGSTSSRSLKLGQLNEPHYDGATFFLPPFLLPSSVLLSPPPFLPCFLPSLPLFSLWDTVTLI